MNTPGFEPGTQWSEIECSTARPSTPHSQLTTETLDSVFPEIVCNTAVRMSDLACQRSTQDSGFFRH